MSGLTHTKIPTACLFGKKNAYSWNPVRGCNNLQCPLHPKNKGKCWAASICRRMAGPWAKNEIKNNKFQYPHLDKAIKFVTEELKSFNPQWLGTQYVKVFPKERSCILVGYQTDLAFVPVEWVDRIIEKIIEDNRERKITGLPLHIFPFLTKAPGKLYPKHSWPENCWLGITAMNQQQFDDGLASIAGMKKRFIYAYLEPLTEKVNIVNKGFWIDWVIVGGGPDPLNPDWVRSIRDQCREALIPFYFKQWGKWLPYWCPFDKIYKYSKALRGHKYSVFDGEKWEQFPEVES